MHRKNRRAWMAMLVLLAAGSAAAVSQSHETVEIVGISSNECGAGRLRSMGFDLLAERDKRIYVVADAQDLIRLSQERIPFLIETSKFQPASRPKVSIAGGINGDYHSPSELEADLKALEKTFPQLANVYTIGRSLENRNLYALKVSDNVSRDEDEAEVLILGCHHAREWISVEIPFLFGKHLLEAYGTDPEIRNIVDASEVWLVPLVNPDGLEYTIHVYRYWRKNRRANKDGSYGVDLNRNYGHKWGYDELGSSGFPDSDVYRGESAFSEPEIQAVRDLFVQKRFRALISYHSYSQVIMYPWGYANIPTADERAMDEIARAMSQLIRPVNGRVYGYGRAAGALYVTNGDTTDWTYSVSGIPSYTIELPPVDVFHGGFFNAESDILPLFRENLPALLYLVRTSIQNYPGSADQEREKPATSRLSGRSSPRKN